MYNLCRALLKSVFNPTNTNLSNQVNVVECLGGVRKEAIIRCNTLKISSDFVLTLLLNIASFSFFSFLLTLFSTNTLTYSTATCLTDELKITFWVNAMYILANFVQFD